MGFGVARAGVPADADALIYTGVLEENGDLVEGSRAIRLTIFEEAAAGAELCSVNDPAASVVRGRFRIALPASCVSALEGNRDAFVEVRVADVPIGPRSRVAAVPFALEARTAHAAASASALRTELDALARSEAVSAAVVFSNGSYSVALQSAPWIDSITLPQAGEPLLNLVDGFFSAQPHCACSIENAGVFCGIGNTATAVQVKIRGTAGEVINQPFQIVCVGPR